MGRWIGIFFLFCASSLPAHAEVAATIVFFSGQPTLTGADGAIRSVTRGGAVMGGDLIDTHDGHLQLRFRDGASMSLQPGTRFKVDRFQYSGQASDGVVMSLIKGALRTVTGLLGKQDRTQYRIGTSVATIGIRGTEFGAVMDGSGLAVSTYAGLVEVCSQVGCADVEPGRTIWVRSLGERPSFVAPSGRAGEYPGLNVLPEGPAVQSGTLPSPAAQSAPESTGAPTGSPSGRQYSPSYIPIK